jgi:FtsH-binding integral membrane protein
MWHALKAELAYFRLWLLGGLGIAAGVVMILSVLTRFANDGDGPPVFVVAVFPIIAGMVVAFIAQSYRVEERRARLLLSGPLTPRQLAWVTVLLPLCFVGLGAIALPPMIGLAALVAGKLEPAAWRIAGGFAVQFWAYAQMGPLAQESCAARRQHRVRGAIVGWGVFVGVILVSAGAQFFLHSIQGHLAQAMAVVAAMVVAATLYQGRTDFTR